MAGQRIKPLNLALGIKDQDISRALQSLWAALDEHSDRIDTVETTVDAGTGVPTTRLINTTAPLTGGGDLSADRTLAVDTFTSGASGVVPASGGGTSKFLRADVTWAVPYLKSEIFGSGLDGNLTYDGSATVLGVAPSSSTYTLTRDVIANDLTVNNGVTIKANGFRIFALGTLTNNGVIADNGFDGATVSGRTTTFYANTASAVSGGVNGTNSTAAPYPYLSTTAALTGGTGGGVGSPGNTGGTGATGQGGSGGGGGGSAGAGGNNGGTGGSISVNANNGVATYNAWLRGGPDKVSISTLWSWGSGGGGGGAGAGNSVSGNAQGGGGGGIVFVTAFQLAGSGAYQAKGGNGANGASLLNAGGCGGGGGGAGGFILLAYATSTGTWTTDVTGGTGGTGGAANGTGQKGGDGGHGGSGVVVKWNLSGDGT